MDVYGTIKRASDQRDAFDIGAGGSQEVFIQTANPNRNYPIIWFETGLGATGNDFTMWFGDNT